jgi:hypothetical protein
VNQVGSTFRALIPTALSLFVGPGVGQIYNREFKKGFVLMGISLVLAVAFFAWLHMAIFGQLSSDPMVMSPEQLARVMESFNTDVLKNHLGTVIIYMAGILLVWIYGVIDAYLNASRRYAALAGSSKQIKGEDNS